MTAVVLGAARTHLRQQGMTPLTWMTGGVLPVCLAWILHVKTGESGLRLVAGVSAAAMIDTVAILIVFAVLFERQWNTLEMAAAAPRGVLPVLAGRFLGIAVQALPTLAVSGVFVQLAWGGVRIDRPLPTLLGMLVLTLSVVVVMLPLAVVVLRFRYAAGMTNGVPALLLAVSGALIPIWQMPPLLQSWAKALPLTWAVDAVEAGDWNDLGVATVLVAAWAVLGAALFHLALRGMRGDPDAYRM
ncbi:hypothetical protein Ssi03_68620 [Sphaerisporangium siamense]|uniref:ABC-2 type transporter transmembrane domain-containing protein n=1 Tax=Sphaerisporangium siamense TaxID=795645 RepID=A0A7W7G7H0_9ACTN|nr:ABC transporter permease [Sphaerisporangium siamense]MBB4700598.1 hypothetical protein [Sphaerisporangium siamense]GII88872.1 hypothetical protein Ssi03_68620 [Sphaerisporangium siamense]